MSVINLTQSDGTRTRIMPMTVAAPSQTATRGDFDRMATDANVDRLRLADLLSALAMQERNAVNLYRAAAGRTSVEAWRERYETFGRQSETHAAIYEELIGSLHGDPRYVSPMARLCEFRNSKMMDTVLLGSSVEPATLEIADLEMVLQAEMQCHANWELLKAMSARLHDGETKRALDDAIGRVEPEEDEHVAWAKRTWQETHLILVLQRA